MTLTTLITGIIFSIILVLLVFIISLSIVTLTYNKTNIITQYRIYKKVRPNIDKLLKNITVGNWHITRISWSNTTKLSKNRYKMFVEVKNDDSNNNRHNWSGDFIEVDENGNILKETLKHSCELFATFEKRKKEVQDKVQNINDEKLKKELQDEINNL